MTLFADLHIHGKYSRATSKDLTIPNLEKYARIKGVSLLGTGDFTQPDWIAHIKESLPEEREGIFYTKTGFPFMLTSEISLIYTQNGKGRRIHNILLAPSLDVVAQITEWLKTKGRVDYDGRPIFKIPCPELVESLKNISKDIEIIPAHAWTPWFGMLGSNGGFESVEECFGDQSKHIHALETGLSSDPAMNWRLSALDRFALVSFSDSHSYWPWKIGREVTLFDTKLDYKEIIRALQTKEDLAGTVEVDPAYGKYHWDGHRACDVVLSPAESRKNKSICPVCKRKLTIGVEHRVEELADRPPGYKPKDAKPYYSLLPLAELIAAATKKGIATKGTTEIYYKLLKLGNEFDILLNVPEEKITESSTPELAKFVMLNRAGKIKVMPGYDGEYGVPVFGQENNTKKNYVPPSAQKSLGDY